MPPTQDKYDDIAVGIKSTALRFGENTKPWLAAFGTAMVGGLALTGHMCEQTWPYYLSVVGIGAHLSRQVWTLDINDPDDCGEKFRSNRKVGLVLFLGIVCGNLLKPKSDDDS